MLLPGGLPLGGEAGRAASFKVLTGEVELLLEDARRARSAAHAVTEVLAAALHDVGGRPATADSVRALCVEDRRLLMRRLACALGRERGWLTAMCGACGAPFDVHVDQADLPVKPAGPHYPRALVETSAGELWFRVPTGLDQEQTAELPSDEALTALVTILAEDGVAHDWSDADLDAIDAGIDRESPRVATTVVTSCPTCGESTAVEIDPYALLHAGSDDILEEVHALASVYGWGERDILGLSSSRRHEYLRMVARDAAVVAR